MGFKRDRHLPHDMSAKMRTCVRCEGEFYVHGNAARGYDADVLCPDCIAEDDEEAGPPDVLDLMFGGFDGQEDDDWEGRSRS